MDKIYGEKYFDRAGETERRFSGQEYLFSQGIQASLPSTFRVAHDPLSVTPILGNLTPSSQAPGMCMGHRHSYR